MKSLECPVANISSKFDCRSTVRRMGLSENAAEMYRMDGRAEKLETHAKELLYTANTVYDFF